MSSPPRMLITGASGFVGRHLLKAFQDEYQIVGIARRSQTRSGASTHPNITWYQADIGHRESLVPIFREIRAGGPVDVAIHLAAHYDFTGEESRQYWHTNVEGLRHVLELCKDIGLKRFIFSSSVAASRFPPPGGALDESSPPDGEHVYARTKALGEQMVQAYHTSFPSTIVRFAALFSDWCEYPPLYMFLSTWLSKAWNARVLGGLGRSAIPYLHVHDLAMLMRRVIERMHEHESGEVFVASPDGSVSHRELFEEATLLYTGQRARPVLMPRPLCGPGMWALDTLGRLLGERPFERPWMARYIDLAMNVDSHRTRERLGWEPRQRLEIVRRLPFLIENMRTHPLDWNRKNREAMKVVELSRNLQVHRLLETHLEEIRHEFHDQLLGPDGRTRLPHYHNVSDEEHEWNHRLIIRHLMNAARSQDRGVFIGYCRDLAERRYRQGYEPQELCEALGILNRVCFKILRRDRESDGLRDAILDHVTMTLRIGCDQVQDVFETLDATGGPSLVRGLSTGSPARRERERSGIDA